MGHCVASGWVVDGHGLGDHIGGHVFRDHVTDPVWKDGNMVLTVMESVVTIMVGGHSVIAVMETVIAVMVHGPYAGVLGHGVLGVLGDGVLAVGERDMDRGVRGGQGQAGGQGEGQELGKERGYYVRNIWRNGKRGY